MFNFIVYKAAQIAALLLPRSAGRWLACRLADVKCQLVKKDRLAVEQNLKLILNLDAHGARRLAPEVFRNFGRYLVDFLRVGDLSKNFIRRYIRIVGQEHLDEGFSRGKGVIGLTAHFGNWELGGGVISRLGYQTNAVALSHKDTLVNNFFLRQRSRWGIKVIPLGVAVKRCFSALSNNELVAVLGDRDFSGHGIEVEFLGKKAVFPKGPATFSLKAEAAIVPGFCIMEERGRYLLVFEKALDVRLTGHFDTDLKTLTQEIARVIEKYVRRYPTQWYNFTPLENETNAQ